MAYRANLFAATVCNTVRPMLWTVVLSCLPVRPVCVVGVLRQNGYRWIKMPLSRDRCRSRPKRHCVIHGDPAPPPDAHNPAIFGPCLLWPKGWMGQDATWYGGIGLTIYGLRQSRINRGSYVLWPNGWMDQDPSQGSR